MFRGFYRDRLGPALHLPLTLKHEGKQKRRGRESGRRQKRHRKEWKVLGEQTKDEKFVHMERMGI